jgi:vancomycin resistance protein VanW
MNENIIVKPIKRSKIRKKIGMLYYGLLRRTFWMKMHHIFAKEKKYSPLLFLQSDHKTPLLRQLKDVDMWYQHNKIINLKIAVKKLDKIVIHPGEVFSYWVLIGKPTSRKGYIDGMVLNNGGFGAGIGGGLCQLSNLIFWMTLHTPLTVIERHRHGYDVFPDSNRTQPFGSGATCFYPHGDLMIRNDTPYDFQLLVNVGEEYLEGEWRSNNPAEFKYKIVERNHEMKGEFWGGYSRHNELYKQILDLDGIFIREDFVVSNSAIMMYSPFLSDNHNVV